jgi:hypothetical protein
MYSMTKSQYGDELIVPIGTLRQIAAAYPARQGFNVHRQLGQAARVAIIERGLEDTPNEHGGMAFDALHLTAQYLSDKEEFTPEEQREVAAALRDLGRFAYHFPENVGLREGTQQQNKT